MIREVATAVILAGPENGIKTDDFAKWLQGIFGPIFLSIIGIVAIFFLFTREVTRFVQFIVLAIVIAIVFYYPGIIETIAEGAANALGVETNG